MLPILYYSRDERKTVVQFQYSMCLVVPNFTLVLPGCESYNVAPLALVSNIGVDIGGELGCTCSQGTIYSKLLSRGQVSKYMRGFHLDATAHGDRALCSLYLLVTQKNPA